MGYALDVRNTVTNVDIIFSVQVCVSGPRLSDSALSLLNTTFQTYFSDQFFRTDLVTEGTVSVAL